MRNGAPSAVMWVLCQSIALKRKLIQKVKLCNYKLVNLFMSLIYDHELWLLNQRTGSHIQTDITSMLHIVSGLKPSCLYFSVSRGADKCSAIFRQCKSSNFQTIRVRFLHEGQKAIWILDKFMENELLAHQNCSRADCSSSRKSPQNTPKKI